MKSKPIFFFIFIFISANAMGNNFYTPTDTTMALEGTIGASNSRLPLFFDISLNVRVGLLKNTPWIMHENEEAIAVFKPLQCYGRLTSHFWIYSGKKISNTVLFVPNQGIKVIKKGYDHLPNPLHILTKKRKIKKQD
jgi:hypothetical protein